MNSYADLNPPNQSETEQAMKTLAQYRKGENPGWIGPEIYDAVGVMQRAHHHLARQIHGLATYIAEYIPGEPSRSEGAIECAIRLLHGAYCPGQSRPLGLSSFTNHEPPDSRAAQRQKPAWEETFFAVAETFAQRATCPRLQTACVLVNAEHQILATGFNGAPRHLPDCAEVGCFMVDHHCRRTLHAETNALLQAAYVGVSVRGATAYVLHMPCYACSLGLVQAGITEVIYREVYDNQTPDQRTADLYRQAQVRFRRIFNEASA